MILVERGILDLDAPIARWLPAWGDVRVLETFDADPVPAEGAITVRHLLSHRAGITYGFLDRGPIGDAYRGLGVRDLIAPEPETQGDNMARLVQAPLAFHPGARWRYGLSTDLLGHLIEVATGESLADFFEREVFAPLGMHKTGFRVPDAAARELAALYTRTPDGGLVPVPGPDGLGSDTFLSGGGGLMSTALDYARFAQMLLREGALDGVRILKASTVRTMLTSETADLDPSPLGPGRAFGLGFRLEEDGAFGWEGIYGTAFRVRPATQSVEILILQQTPRNPGGIEEAFRDMAQEWLTSPRPLREVSR
jgi:CubicO group peptidase (beta-lactamase class C family)